MIFSEEMTIVVRPDGKVKESPPRNGKDTVLGICRNVQLKILN